MKRACTPVKREYFRWKQSGWEDKLIKAYSDLKGNLDLIVKKCEADGLTIERSKIRKKLNDLIKSGVIQATPEWNAHVAKVWHIS